jgi:hypothetical protein
VEKKSQPHPVNNFGEAIRTLADFVRTYPAILLLVVAAAGCSHDAEEAGAVNEAKAIKIARETVAANTPGMTSATYKAQREGDGWSVLVEAKPAVPGAHLFIQIDKDGKVTRYGRGL